MKSLIKRILVGFIVLVFIFIILLFFAKYRSQEKEYIYVTNENKWGTSNKCYVEEKSLICKNDSELVRVKQFYYEEK